MDIGLLLVVFLGVLLVFTILRNSRQQRDIRRIQESLAVGTKVATGSGMLATVVAVDDDAVVLESEPGHRSRWVRAAVVRVLETPDTGEASEDSGPVEAPTGEATGPTGGAAGGDARPGDEAGDGGAGDGAAGDGGADDRGGRRPGTD